jgi:hypothetical protein
MGSHRTSMRFFVILPLVILDGSSCNDPDVREQQRDLIRQIDQAELRRESTLAGYTVTEYYTIKNSHLSKAAEATIETTYKRGQGPAAGLRSCRIASWTDCFREKYR